jgi:hypothetical protein
MKRKKTAKEDPLRQKVRKLQQLAEALRGGESFSITRLTVIKSLCQEVKTAARFTL